jgi:hypothetical protein
VIDIEPETVAPLSGELIVAAAVRLFAACAGLPINKRAAQRTVPIIPKTLLNPCDSVMTQPPPFDLARAWTDTGGTGDLVTPPRLAALSAQSRCYFAGVSVDRSPSSESGIYYRFRRTTIAYF